ncbi:MAG: DUF3526 domain-containing protein [Myxococcota bacterium]
MTLLSHTLRTRVFAIPSLIVLALFASMCLYAARSGLEWRAVLEAEIASIEEDAFTKRSEWLLDLAEVEKGSNASPYAAQPMSLPFAAVRRLDPLADFSFSRQSLQPRSTTVNGWRNATSLWQGHELEAPTSLAQGRIDLSLCVIVLWPLLLLILGFGALNSDREAGRLELLMVHGASPLRLVVFRVGIPALCTWLILSGVATVAAVSVPDSGRMGSFFSWWWVASLYGLGWTALVMAVASTTRSFVVEGVSSLVLWSLLVLVLPSLSQGFAHAVKAPPSQVAYLSRARAAQAEAKRNLDSRVSAFLSGHLDAADGDDEVPNYYRAAYLANLEVRQTTEEIRREYARSRREQSNIMRWAALVAPVSGIFAELQRITGTTPDAALDYEIQTARFLNHLHDAIGPAVVAKSRLSLAQANMLTPFELKPVSQPVHGFGWLGWFVLCAVGVWATFKNTRVPGSLALRGE